MNDCSTDYPAVIWQYGHYHGDIFRDADYISYPWSWPGPCSDDKNKAVIIACQILYIGYERYAADASAAGCLFWALFYIWNTNNSIL